MTLQINMNPGSSANGGVGVGVMTSAGNPWTVADALAQTLVNQGRASPLNWPAEVPGLTSAEILAFRTSVSGAGNLSADRAFAAVDDGKSFYATANRSMTLGAGLGWLSGVWIDCPASGTVSIVFSSTTGNGTSTTITRTRSNNPAGFVIVPHTEAADTYGVSGS